MTLSPVSEVLLNAPNLKPINNVESPRPLHFDPKDYLTHPPSPSMEGVLKKGSHILQLSIRGDFIETKRLIPFKATQDVFFKMIDDHMLFSLDQKKWKSFDEVFSWNIGLDLPVDSEGRLDDFYVDCEIKTQKPNIIK